MKKCGRCGEDVALGLFRKSARSKDGLQSWCTPCFTKYERDRYKAGDRTRKEANKKRSETRGKKFVREYLESHPCVDCGEPDIVVLDFDHQRDKVSHVCEMYHHSLASIAEEIAKCEVRCANCHRRKTARTLGSWRL